MIDGGPFILSGQFADLVKRHTGIDVDEPKGKPMANLAINLGYSDSLGLTIQWTDRNNKSHETVVDVWLKPRDNTEQLELRVNGVLLAIHNGNDQTLVVREQREE